MKHLKRLSALVLAAMMVLALGATAFADTNSQSITSLTIEKELTAFNPDGKDVSAPEISYTYEIKAGEKDVEITDSTGVKALTNEGVTENMTITGSIAWNADEILETASNGKKNTKDIVIGFAAVDFEQAGIFRYEITETPGDLAASGVTDGGSHKRILDLYVKDSDDENAAGAARWVVYGAVLFAPETDDSGAVVSMKKTTGFVADEAAAADCYYTLNLTVSQTLVGDRAKNMNKFPFTVSFENSALTSDVLLRQETSGTVTAPAPVKGKLDETVLTPALTSGASVTYIGIPAGTSVSIYEENNVTGTTYKETYVIDGGEPSEGKMISWLDNNKQSEIATVSSTANEAQSARTAAFTNTLEAISPTGVMLRVAPFAAIVLAGSAMLIVLIARSRRNEEEAAA